MIDHCMQFVIGCSPENENNTVLRIVYSGARQTFHDSRFLSESTICILKHKKGIRQVVLPSSLEEDCERSRRLAKLEEHKALRGCAIFQVYMYPL
jgi:hypothetical protein